MTLSTLFLAFLPQSEPTPVDPAAAAAAVSAASFAAAVERARIAEELGDLAAAEAWLRRAAEAPDAAVAAAARAKLRALRERMGRAPREEGGGAEGGSPVERRVAEAIEMAKAGPEFADAAKKEIVWIGEAAIPVIAGKVLESATPVFLRDLLLEAAAQIGGGAALDLLERIAGSEDHLLRRKAVAVFRSRDFSVPLERWTGVLARFLEDRDAGARRQALRNLREHPDAVRPLVDALARDADPEVRQEVAAHYGKILSPESRDALIRDPATGVRLQVVSTLRDRWPDPVSLAIEMLSDPEADVRWQAVREVARFDRGLLAGEELAGPLSRLAEDPSPRVRAALAEAAGTALGASGVPILLRLVRDAEVREAALRSLGRMNSVHFRRVDLPLACETLVEIGRGIAPTAAVVVSQDESSMYLKFFGWFVGSVATPEDFPLLARSLSEVPHVLTRKTDLAPSIFSKARAEDLPVLCALWERLPDDRSRTALVHAFGERGASASSPAHPCVLDVLRAAMGAERPPELRSTAMRAAIQWKAASLVEPILATLELDSPVVGSWRELTDEICGMAATAPGETSRIFVALASMPGNFQGQAPWRKVPECLEKPAALETLSRMFEAIGADSSRADMLWQMARLDEESRFVVEVGLRHPSSEVRGAAVKILGSLDRFEPRAAAAVLERIDDEEPDVRTGVAVYCRRWNVPEAVDPALRLLRDSDRNVRLSAAKTLGSLLSQDAVPGLIAALADEDEKVRVGATEALERIRFYHEEKKRWDDWYRGRGADPGEGVRKLLEALDDPSVDVRLAAIESLGTMGAKEALPRLVSLLKEAPTPAERDAAARALARINRE